MTKYRFTYRSEHKERVIFALVGEGLIGNLFFFLTVSDDVAEGLVVEVAGDVNGGEFHESVDFFFGESSGLTGEGFDQLRGVDLASSSGVQDLESFDHDVLGVSAVEFLGEHVEEGSEVQSTLSKITLGNKQLKNGTQEGEEGRVPGL
jgi:hypothetical protein